MSIRLFGVTRLLLSKEFGGYDFIGIRYFATTQLPSRPLAHVLYARDQIDKLKRQHPEVVYKYILLDMLAKWKTLPPEEKQPFIAEAAKLRMEYDRVKSSLSKEECITVQQLKDERRRQGKARRHIKTAAKEFGRPSPPKKPYDLFVAERRFASHTDGAHGIREQWRLLPPDSKKFYRWKYFELYAAYERELAVWEADMLAQGYGYVVQLFKTPTPTKKEI